MIARGPMTDYNSRFLAIGLIMRYGVSAVKEWEIDDVHGIYTDERQTAL